MKSLDEQLDQARRDPVRLREYLWRAAAACRRRGLRHSAMTIVNNMDELADALTRRANVRPATTNRTSRFPRPNP